LTLEKSRFPGPIKLKLDFESCPIQASMGVLGRKWAFLILRNIAVYRAGRFNDMLRATPGITPRVLSKRLKELKHDGLIQVVDRGTNFVMWDLTEKGRDTLPILMSLVQFGSKWYADKVFSDKTPRKLLDIFHESDVQDILGTYWREMPA
jgi:DNA-binding HxlR family transcriptional regulator